MAPKGSNIESELIETFIAATKKGMSAEEFFAVADATLEHLRGKTKNETMEKILNNTATNADVNKMIQALSGRASNKEK
ncbi:MAG TPA: hypothetical protein QF720_00935 [Nitrospinota bacterium]|jgi:hydroxypyruvate isomerase|nr:hypothetical protein [Nitrospinota bacterium]|tara:strand:- start:207839 stop:208075 length:237 start_codon:yes stop_codon:yes gene_type:complete